MLLFHYYLNSTVESCTDENDTVTRALQRHFYISSWSDKRVRSVNATVSVPIRYISFAMHRIHTGNSGQ